MIEKRLRFSSLDAALPFLSCKATVERERQNSPGGILVVEIAGKVYHLDKSTADKLSSLGGHQVRDSNFRELEFIGLDGIKVSPDWYPELTRIQLAEMICFDESRDIPVIVSSFVSGMTFSANSLCAVPSGLPEHIVMGLNNLAYHYPDQYRYYGGSVLQERGNFQTYQYAARHAGSGLTLKYTVEASAIRIKNVPGLFRYARTLRPPEAMD